MDKESHFPLSIAFAFVIHGKATSRLASLKFGEKASVSALSSLSLISSHPVPLYSLKGLFTLVLILIIVPTLYGLWWWWGRRRRGEATVLFRGIAVCQWNTTVRSTTADTVSSLTLYNGHSSGKSDALLRRQ